MGGSGQREGIGEARGGRKSAPYEWASVVGGRRGRELLVPKNRGVRRRQSGGPSGLFPSGRSGPKGSPKTRLGAKGQPFFAAHSPLRGFLT